MPVPTTGTFKMFDSEETSNPINSSIKGAQIHDASDPVTNVNNFASLISSAQVSLFNPIYSGTITSLSDISSSLQFRDYPSVSSTTKTYTFSTTYSSGLVYFTQLDINNNVLNVNWVSTGGIVDSGTTPYVDCTGNTGTTNVTVTITIPEGKIVHYLNLQSYREVTSVDISNLVNLRRFFCSDNSLTSIDISNQTILLQLELGSNNLTSLDVSNISDFGDLDVSNNSISTLDLSSTSIGGDLFVSNNNLTTIDLSNSTNIDKFAASGNSLTSITVGSSTSLGEFYVRNNSLTSVDVSNYPNLHTLDVLNNSLTSLNISSNTALKDLNVCSNSLTSISFTNNTLLEDISMGGNSGITSLDITMLPLLEVLFANSIGISSLDTSDNPLLRSIYILGATSLTTIDISDNPDITYMIFRGNYQTEASTNGILVDLDNAGLSNGTLRLRNNKSGAGVTAYNSLITKGWNIIDTSTT